MRRIWCRKGEKDTGAKNSAEKEKKMGGKKSKKENPGYVGAVKFWAWQSRGLSAAVQFIILSGFISIYCTNMLGLNPAVVGIILAVSKVIDAVTDLFAGYLVDKTETRLGKGRPYEFALIGLWLCTWLIFSVPEGLSVTLKYVWVVVFYIAAQSVCSTLLSANQNVYMIRAFGRDEQRIRLASFGGIVIMLGSIVVNVIFPTLQKTIATSLSGWSLLVGMFSVIFGVIGIMRFIFVKEENHDVVEKTEKISIKDVFAVLKANKYVYMICIMWMIYYLVNGMGVGTYFYTYVVGDVGIMGVMSLFGMVALPLLFFLPKLSGRISKGGMVMIACIFYIISSLMMFAAGTNIAIMAVASIFGGIASLPITYFTDLMLLDCATYIAYANGYRLDGTFGAIKGCAGKVGSALGSALTGALLAAGGFISTEGNADIVQPDSAIMMIRILMGLVPVILYVIVFIIMKFYDIEKRLPEIQKELDARKGKKHD